MPQIQTLQDEEELDPTIAHQIFLSHSGAQKGFVKDLYKELSRHFTTFFDATDHSLPPGDNFPKHIFHAAQNCELAVIVLSDEFICSKWPMIELCAFVDALPSNRIKILPLFFKLSPNDLKLPGSLKRWRKAWKAYAKKDAKHRINISKWASTLGTLCSQNGIIFDPSLESEQTYLDRIVSKVSQIVPPTIKFDTSHIHGKDRLCKVILDKLEEMQSRAQREICHSHDSTLLSSRHNVSCVLGLYGLPGSGKSTLCKCLQVHFFPLYGAHKLLYLELPSNPSHADLVYKFKDLLGLTTFKGRINLDGVSDLEQVKHLLKMYELPKCKVFVVIDNIAEESWLAVQRILQLGIGRGSKVILVAHTHDILRPILGSLKNGHPCICDCMHIPSINESEAIQIILQPTRGCTMTECTFQQNFTPRQRETALKIVRMCNFGSQDELLYLPLVMEIMGAMLIKYGEDLEGWGSSLQSLWARVKMYKEDAVKMLVGESFKTLPHEDLQLLFVDVALFILPLQLQGVREIYALLSFMHGVTTSRMEIMIKDLERHCFLTVSEDGITAHSVYLEFAKSIQEGHTGFMKCHWRHHKDMDVIALKRLKLVEEKDNVRAQLRAMILEVGEECERVDLQGFSSLKAVVVRNCRSLAVLSLAGLSSLVSLDVENCAEFQQIECMDGGYVSLPNIKRLRIDQKRGVKRKRALLHVDEWGQLPYLQAFMKLLQRVIAPQRPTSLEGGIARHMRGLQVLSLQNTGIRRLEDMSSCWPHLQNLFVVECWLEVFEVGKLPKLKRFHFSDHHASDALSEWEEWGIRDYGVKYKYGDAYRVSESWRCKKGDSRFMLPGKDLLVGCPELEEVVMESAFLEGVQMGALPPNLVMLKLHCLHTATWLPDLSLSAHTLERIDVQWCEKLGRVDLVVGFAKLEDLYLSHCDSLVEVTSAGFLPSLRKLCVLFCDKLRTVVGFEDSKMLKHIQIGGCLELCEIPSLSGLIRLEVVCIGMCPNLTSLGNADLKNLTELKFLCVPLDKELCLKVRNLENLQRLYVDRPSRNTIETCNPNLISFSSLVAGADNGNVSESLSSANLRSLKTVLLNDLCNVASMDGIEHLFTLTNLCLQGLGNLTSVQGIGSLVHLGELNMIDCPLLEELPSLHALVKMQFLRIVGCPRLKAVEGCDVCKDLCECNFDGCTSMACFPFNDPSTLSSTLHQVSFTGCKFASNIETMVAWAVDEKVPRPLRVASVESLVWEYYNNFPHREEVVEAFLPRMLGRLLANDEDCIDFQGLESCLEQRRIDEFSRRDLQSYGDVKGVEGVAGCLAKWYPAWDCYRSSSGTLFPIAAVRELEEYLRGKPKKALVQMHCKSALLGFLEDAHVTSFFTHCDPKKYRAFYSAMCRELLWKDLHSTVRSILECLML